ncbi:MAG TPA: hypothetical protein VMP08_18380, partial [Anaerolineae bacterium]|nr:hypothetical protein [Anaerolineae bacterium]
MPEDNKASTPRQTRLLSQTLLIGAIAGSLTTVVYIFLYFQTQAWQILVAALGVAAGTACLFPAWHQLRRHEIERTGYWILAAIVLACGVAEAVWVNNTLFALAGGLLLIILVGNLIRPQRWIIWIGIAIGYIAYIILVNYNQPLPRYDIAQVPLLNVFVPIALGLLLVLVIWQTVQGYFTTYTLRTKLMVSFLAVALIPLGLVAIVIANYSRQAALESANQLLRSGATKVADEIDDLITTNLKEIEAEAQLTALARYLANDQRIGSPEEEELADVLQALVKRDAGNIVSYAL